MPPSELAFDSTGKKLNQDEVQECIEELRLLVLADSHYYMRKDDSFLLRYLHCAGFKIFDAYKRIKLMNELKIENPDWFAHSAPSEHSLIMSWNAKVVLNGRDRCGRTIYYTKLANIDASKTTIQQVAQYDDMWMESILDEPETQANGLCCVIDLSGFSWKLFRWFTPSNVRIGSRKTEYLPVKKLKIHVVNSSMLLNATVAIVFPFLSSKTKEQIHFHYENWPSLHKFIDPQYLPEEYGGVCKNINFEQRHEWLLSQTPRLLDNFKNDKRM